MRSKKRIFSIIRLIGKGILLLLFSFLVAGIIGFNKEESRQINLKEGDIVLEDILAPFGFSYIDEEKTRFYRQKNKNQVRDIYDLNSQIEQDIRAKIDSLSTLLATEENEQKDVKNKLIQICSFLLKNGIIDSEIKQGLIDRSVFLLTVDNPELNISRRRLVEQLLTVEDIDARIKEQVIFYFPENRKLRLTVEKFIKKNISPNLVFNKQKTETQRQEAWNNVPEVKREVKKNQLIVARGQRVDDGHLSQFAELSKKGDSSRFLSTFAGLNLLILIFVILFRRYVRKLSFAISSFSLFCLLSFIFLLFFLLAKGVVIFSISPLFIPFSFAPMLVAILLNVPLAIFLTVPLAFFSGLLSNSLDIAILCFISGVVGIYAVEGVKKRARLVKAGFLIGFANIFVILSFVLLGRQEFSGVIKSGLWGMSNGLVSALLVLGFLPLFEHLFKLTTNISLLELSDFNHPLLKKLIIEAPGTYHHSLVVGNLSESASEAIGANSLLARVASYYHDIGKIEKSEYFSENQRGKNRHDKLTPTMSSLIIIKHVKQGVEMAHKYNLPRQIIDIIEQHHGTSLAPYFYQRALEISKGEEVSQENFRYPGPNPRTKEAAIVLLADSVEASSRSLDNPTPTRLKVLVEKTINDKFIDHQLDECNLALTDLSKISQSFTYVLSGIFHNRVKYPTTNK